MRGHVTRIVSAAVVFVLVLLCVRISPVASASDVDACSATLLSRCSVDVDTGLRMSYVATGPVGGPVLLLLHGLTNSADAWVPTMRALASRMPEHRIIALDLRGHGATSRPTGRVCNTTPERCFSMTEMAADVVGFMSAMGIDRAAIAGHSMGSLVAQQVALADPKKVSALILIGTTSDARRTPILGTWLVDQVIEGQWRERLVAQGIAWPSPALDRTPLDADPDIVSWLRTYWNVYPVSPQNSTEAIARQTARVPLMTWLGATKAILDYAATAQLRRLRVPTLVLWGTQDVFFGQDDQRALIGALAVSARHGGSFCWKQYGQKPLPANGLQGDDLGHNLTWEAPAQIAGDVAAFLMSGRPTASGFVAGADGSILRQGRAQVVCAGERSTD